MNLHIGVTQFLIKSIVLAFFEDRLEVANSAVLPDKLTIEKLRYGHYAIRNMFLLIFMDNYRYIDGLVCGIPTMVAAMGDRIWFE